MTLNVHSSGGSRGSERDDHQTYLNYYMAPLASYHAGNLLSTRTLPTELGGIPGKGYNRLKCITGGSHPSELLQKLTSFTGIYDFLNLGPHHYAQLVPKIRIYRELGVKNVTVDGQSQEPRRNRWVRTKGKFNFSNYMDNSALTAITNRVEAFGGEVGIKSFSYDDHAQHPTLPAQIFSCKLKLYAKSLQALAMKQYDLIHRDYDLATSDEERDATGVQYLTCPISVAALLRPASDVSDVMAYHPEVDGGTISDNVDREVAHTAIKIRIGWELPPYSELALQLGEGNSYLNTALAMMEQEFDLYFQKYDISFNDDGSVEVDIDYVGNVFANDPEYLTDVLSSGDFQTREETQQENRQAAQNAADHLGVTTLEHAMFSYESISKFIEWHATGIRNARLEGSRTLMNELFPNPGYAALPTLGYGSFLSAIDDSTPHMVSFLYQHSNSLYQQVWNNRISNSDDEGAGADKRWHLHRESGATSADNKLRHPSEGLMSVRAFTQRLKSDMQKINTRIMWPLFYYWGQNSKHGFTPDSVATLGRLSSGFWNTARGPMKTSDTVNEREAKLYYHIMTADGAPLPAHCQALGITEDLAEQVQQLLLQIEETVSAPNVWGSGLANIADHLIANLNSNDQSSQVVIPSEGKAGVYNTGNRLEHYLNDYTPGMGFFEFFAWSFFFRFDMLQEVSTSGRRTTYSEDWDGRLEGVYFNRRNLAWSNLGGSGQRLALSRLRQLATALGEEGVQQRVESQHVSLVDDVYDQLYRELKRKNRLYVLPVTIDQFRSTNLSDADLLAKVRIPQTATMADLLEDAEAEEAEIHDQLADGADGTEGQQAADAQEEYILGYIEWLQEKADEWVETETSTENYALGIIESMNEYLDDPDNTHIGVYDVSYDDNTGLNHAAYQEDPIGAALWEEAVESGAYVRSTNVDAYGSYFSEEGIEEVYVPVSPTQLTQDDVETRIYFTYLGDIIEAIFTLTSENAAAGRAEIILGPYFYKGFSLCIADMPISLTLLNRVWLREVRNSNGETLNSMPLGQFVDHLISAINEEVLKVRTGTANLSRSDLIDDHYMAQRNLQMPHLSSTDFDSWWPRASGGYLGRIDVADPNFAFPVPYTSDDLNFTQVSYVYGGAAALPASMNGDLENDLYGFGRSQTGANNSSLGTDSYYEQFGPIYHLRWGADRGIIKNINFTTIDDSALATFFIAQDYNLDAEGATSTVTTARNAAAREEEPNPADELEDIEGEEEWQRQQREQDAEVSQLLENVQGLATVALHQQVSFTAVGCSLFRNGYIVYIDPKMPGVSTATLEDANVTEALSIGGYYMIHETSGIVKDGVYEVEVKAQHVGGQLI